MDAPPAPEQTPQEVLREEFEKMKREAAERRKAKDDAKKDRQETLYPDILGLTRELEVEKEKNRFDIYPDADQIREEQRIIDDAQNILESHYSDVSDDGNDGDNAYSSGASCEPPTSVNYLSDVSGVSDDAVDGPPLQSLGKARAVWQKPWLDTPSRQSSAPFLPPLQSPIPFVPPSFPTPEDFSFMSDISSGGRFCTTTRLSSTSQWKVVYKKG